jgi:hypothetical protein
LRNIDVFKTRSYNLNNWFQNVGPALPRRVLNVSGIANLPLGLEIASISSFNGAVPSLCLSMIRYAPL